VVNAADRGVENGPLPQTKRGDMEAGMSARYRFLP
jgi:hypothetical protein